jgi:hypothetical protein
LLKGEGFQRKLLNHISYSWRILLHAWDSQKWKHAARSLIAILDLKRLSQKAWRKHWRENSAWKKRVQGINCCLLYSSIDSHTSQRQLLDEPGWSVKPNRWTQNSRTVLHIISTASFLSHHQFL